MINEDIPLYCPREQVMPDDIKACKMEIAVLRETLKDKDIIIKGMEYQVLRLKNEIKEMYVKRGY